MLLAYIDPGSGYIVLQAIAAAFIGGLAYFRHTIARVFRRLRRRRDDAPSDGG
jgi:hypothetical protein